MSEEVPEDISGCWLERSSENSIGIADAISRRISGALRKIIPG